MNKRAFTTLIVIGATLGCLAQKKDFTYKFYGQVRNDIYFNSRQNNESVDGALLSYPKDHDYDPAGKDLNGESSLNFYNMHTRLGLDVTGPNLGKIKTSANIEMDFRGNSTNLGIVRMRHAYLNLEIGKHSLLLGQTWHPLNNTLRAELMNLNVGAPYQPLNRSPQIRYQYRDDLIMFRAAAVWQAQMASTGPNGASREYLRNSKIPELFASIDVHDKQSYIGVSIYYLSLVPRLKTDEGYKVNERVNGLTFEAHGKYQKDLLTIGAKTFLSENFNQANTLGGYGVTKINATTGEQEYAPIRLSHSWINIMYGKKWRGGVFGGYLKNLGASKAITNIVGKGTNLDQMYTLVGEMTFNIPNWKFGLEYNFTNAFYGTNTAKGKVKNTHSVSNHRIVASVLFMF